MGMVGEGKEPTEPIRSVKQPVFGGKAMAVKDKAMFTVELEKHQMAFLEEMMEQYQIPDTSKALRILITYFIGKEYTAAHKTKRIMLT